MDKNELLKYLICEIDLVMHDKDYRFENEDGTWYSRESCKNLTNEEVFEELKGELRQLAKIEDDFADLEAKLAESEAKIACREDEIKFKEADINQLKWILEGKKKDIDQLKQQLAEKEKEKEDWIRAFEELALDSIDYESYNATVDEYEKEIEELKIYQNQTAIAELNNILDTFAIFVNEEKESMVSLDGNGNLSLLEYIENRIDILKGEK